MTAVLTLLLTVTTALSAKEIVWDKDSLVLIREGGNYGRMLRLDAETLLCCFELSGSVCARRSTDEGQTWHSEVLIATCQQGAAANPFVLRLKSGAVLCFYNERPLKGSGHPYAIRVSASKDAAKTWRPPVRLYSAGQEFENGCWEPAAVQLPRGEIQLFFSNEGPYRSTPEQEITLMRSLDEGTTWSEPQTVAFRKGHRDGMPVPLVLNDNKGLLLAIEDDGLSGRFKPVILSTSVENSWADGLVNGSSARRWSALKTSLPAPVYAGAPFICQLPSGETVLSVQRSDDDPKKARMAVYLGTDEGKAFDSPSMPFPPSPGASGLWNSLFVKGSNTITAVTATTLRGRFGIWAIDGHIACQKR